MHHTWHHIYTTSNRYEAHTSAGDRNITDCTVLDSGTMCITLDRVMVLHQASLPAGWSLGLSNRGSGVKV